MKTFEYVSNTGIGDLIHARQLLDTFRATGNRVNVVLGVWKGGNGWASGRLEFLIWLSNKLFASQGYDVTFSANKLGNSPLNLLDNPLMRPQIPDFRNEFECRKQKKAEYSVILTKVRGLEKTKLSNDLPEINRLILNLASKMPLILVGEREIEYNNEYQIHGDRMIYSLYENFKNLLPDAIDLTIPALGITSPTETQFLRDCKIMSSAKRVICFGSGGNVSIAMSVSDVINYYDGQEMGRLFSRFHGLEDKFITDNYKLFCEKLASV